MLLDKTVLAFGGPRHDHHHTHVEMVDPSVEKGARFLDEVQQKAEERITNAMLLDVPGFDAKLVSYEISHEFMTGDDIHHVAFQINGRVFKERFVKNDWTDEKIADFLVQSLARSILIQMAPTLASARMLNR